jgi:hypothetical protein
MHRPGVTAEPRIAADHGIDSRNSVDVDGKSGGNPARTPAWTPANPADPFSPPLEAAQVTLDA